MTRRHPYRAQRWRKYLVEAPLTAVLLALPAGLLGLASAVGVVCWVVENFVLRNIVRLDTCTIWAVAEMFSLDWTVHLGLHSSTEHTAELLIAMLRLLLPPVFFAAMVFKVIVLSKPFQFRRIMSLCSPRSGAAEKELVVRFYNRLPVAINSVKVAVFARIPYVGTDGKRSLKNVSLLPRADFWPFSHPAVPWTLRIPIRDRQATETLKPKIHGPDDYRIEVDYSGGTVPQGLQLRRIRKGEVMRRTEDCDIFIAVEGLLPDLGVHVAQSHSYRIPGDVLLGNSEGVDVDYSVPAHKWAGWNRFEENEQDVFVFGYGSLVLVELLAKFLGRRALHPDEYEFCRLYGYRRCWNVAVDNTEDVPGYKYYRRPDTKVRPDVRVTYLNIYRSDPKQWVNGIVFRVTQSELRKTRERERNYDMVDVTRHVDIEPPGAVVTFVGRADATQRCRVGAEKGNAVIVASYRTPVEGAFRALGEESWNEYESSTDAPDIPTVELEAVDIPTERESGLSRCDVEI